MNFSVQMPDELVHELERLAKYRGKSRNAVIREAVTELVEKEKQSRWNEFLDFLNNRGPEDYLPEDFPPFESHRSELPPPREYDF